MSTDPKQAEYIAYFRTLDAQTRREHLAVAFIALLRLIIAKHRDN